jgi:hypothetical protein
MIHMAVLQDCMGFVEGAPDPYSETYVKCDVEAPEQVTIKVEVAIDINDEIPDAETLSSIKTEHEVSLWGGGGGWWQFMLLMQYISSKRNCEITLNISSFVFYIVCAIYLLNFGMPS